jgi:hypothetical protein
MCQRWHDDVWAFVADVGERPSAKHSLDRVNPDGNYEPGNVRWATAAEQLSNRRPFEYHQRMHKRNTSGYMGVSPHYGDRWSARIKVDGVEHCLGTFDLIDGALRARIEAEIRLLGQPKPINRPHAVRLGLIT